MASIVSFKDIGRQVRLSLHAAGAASVEEVGRIEGNGLLTFQEESHRNCVYVCCSV